MLLQKLYSLGGRKFVLTSLMPLGNSPVITRPNIIGTPSALNYAAELYNARLKTLLDSLKAHLSDFNFVVVNQYNIISNLTQSPPSRTGTFNFISISTCFQILMQHYILYILIYVLCCLMFITGFKDTHNPCCAVSLVSQGANLSFSFFLKQWHLHRRRGDHWFRYICIYVQVEMEYHAIEVGRHV